MKTNLLKIDRIKNITLAVAGRSEPNTFTAPGEKESFIPLLTGSGVHCSRFSFFSAFVIALGAAAAAAGLLLLLLVMLVGRLLTLPLLLVHQP